jgi:hypothetical protein
MVLGAGRLIFRFDANHFAEHTSVFVSSRLGSLLVSLQPYVSKARACSLVSSREREMHEMLLPIANADIGATRELLSLSVRGGKNEDWLECRACSFWRQRSSLVFGFGMQTPQQPTKTQVA